MSAVNSPLPPADTAEGESLSAVTALVVAQLRPLRVVAPMSATDWASLEGTVQEARTAPLLRDRALPGDPGENATDLYFEHGGRRINVRRARGANKVRVFVGPTPAQRAVLRKQQREVSRQERESYLLREAAERQQLAAAEAELLAQERLPEAYRDHLAFMLRTVSAQIERGTTGIRGAARWAWPEDCLQDMRRHLVGVGEIVQSARLRSADVPALRLVGKESGHD